MSQETTFAALPVRQRGTLEIIDTAMKLYRRYFGVLMGWSALVAVLFLLAFSIPFGTFLVYPLISGSACCAVAAAVRGQTIAFSQVWEFTKPRYGALLLITFLSVLLMGVAFGAAFLIATLVTVAGAWMLDAISAPESVLLGVGLIGILVATIVASVLSVMAYAWLGLIPIIACLEDDKRSVAAMGRAWELMKGNWMRVLGLSTLLTIAVIAVMGIIGGAVALVGASMGALVDNPSDMALLGLGLTFTGFISLFFLFWNPIQTLILAVLYLDLRVRKEALDLEWNSYASAPPSQMSAPPPDPARLAESVASEPAPASMSGYVPGSATPAGHAARPPQPLEATSTRPPAPPQMRPPAPANTSLDKAAEPSSASFNPAPPAVTPTPAQNLPATPQDLPATPQGRSTTPPGTPTTPQDVPATPQNLPATPQDVPATPQDVPATPQGRSTAPPGTPTGAQETGSAANHSIPSAQDAFDFSSSFSAGEPATFSVDDHDEPAEDKAKPSSGE